MGDWSDYQSATAIDMGKDALTFQREGTVALLTCIVQFYNLVIWIYIVYSCKEKYNVQIEPVDVNAIQWNANVSTYHVVMLSCTWNHSIHESFLIRHWQASDTMAVGLTSPFLNRGLTSPCQHVVRMTSPGIIEKFFSSILSRKGSEPWLFRTCHRWWGCACDRISHCNRKWTTNPLVHFVGEIYLMTGAAAFASILDEIKLDALDSRNGPRENISDVL